MTIRTKLMTAFALCLTLAIGCTCGLAFYIAKDAAEKSFYEQAAGQLARIEERIAGYLESGEMSVKYLADLNVVKNSKGQLTSYLDTEETTTLLYANHPPHEQAIYDEFIRVHDSNKNFGLVFMANSDGQYAQAPEGSVKSAGYDPRKRSWYPEVMEDDKSVTVSTPYQTTGGGMVCSLMVKTYDTQNKPLGMVGVDFSLESLTKSLDAIKILDTGYIVAFDSTGQVLTDKNHKDNVSKSVADLDKAWQDIFATEGELKVQIDGTDKYVMASTIKDLNWKLAVIFDYDEMMSSSYRLLKSTALSGIIVLILSLAGIFFVARSITDPIIRLVSASQIIASGSYETSQAAKDKLQANLNIVSHGETGLLSSALQSMVKTLTERIDTARRKTEEAEEQSLIAAEASKKAEEARQMAENAKREGLQFAANELENIVEKINSAAIIMTQQIEEASDGAGVQNRRTAEIAEAMSRMSSSVIDVAKSADAAANNAEDAKNKTLSGSAIFKDVIECIGEVSRLSDHLRENLNSLGSRADGIGQVMNVINDIADQTNLLALNAAIEAARAGEAGRGFAVVADEVRKLAEKTMQATREVGDAVKAIQASTIENINAMQEASTAVDKSTQLASDAGNALNGIVDDINATAEEVRSIAIAGNEQSEVGSSITHGADEVNTIASQTANKMHAATEAVAAINALSKDLSSLIKKLREV